MLYYVFTNFVIYSYEQIPNGIVISITFWAFSESRIKLQEHIIMNGHTHNLSEEGYFGSPPFSGRTTPWMYRKADAYDCTCFFEDFSIKNFQLVGRTTQGRLPIVIILSPGNAICTHIITISTRTQYLRKRYICH